MDALDIFKKLNIFIKQRNNVAQECINVSKKWVKNKRKDLRFYLNKEPDLANLLQDYYFVGYQRALFEVMEELKEMLEEDE